MSKSPRNPGSAPNRHRNMLDGPSIKPSIHIRAQHQARQYILLALGCLFCTQLEPMQKPCRTRFFGPAPGPCARTPKVAKNVVTRILCNCNYPGMALHKIAERSSGALCPQEPGSGQSQCQSQPDLAWVNQGQLGPWSSNPARERVGQAKPGSLHNLGGAEAAKTGQASQGQARP